MEREDEGRREMDEKGRCEGRRDTDKEADGGC